jgi:hypothetical protein
MKIKGDFSKIKAALEKAKKINQKTVAFALVYILFF